MTRLQLADLDQPLEPVELPGGVLATLKRLDGVMAQLWHEFTSTPEEDRNPHILWELGARCLPDTDKDVVDKLTVAQVWAVIAAASGNVDKVLAALKNGMGAEMEASNTSSPATLPAPSSASSPAPPDGPPASSP